MSVAPSMTQSSLVVSELPEYVTIHTLQEPNPILRNPAMALTFPLSKDDFRDGRILEAKFEGEANCTGLAAPQIGICKKMIIFAVEDSEDLRKWRPDATQFMPKTLWINPSYEALGEATHVDYEACFSVEIYAAMVPRFKKIRYEAYTLAGEKVTGVAEGFLARAIQHETDHVNGILFIDRAPLESIMTMEAYREIRTKKIAAQGAD